METRRLGRLGHQSSVLIYGAAALGEVTQDVADRSVQEALDAGINHLDVAASYGDAELRLGPWMPRIRDRVVADQVIPGSRPELREEAGITVDPAHLHYFAHWITPSVERKRFGARFFVGQLPAGQTPAIDRHEVIDMTWVTPAQGLARSDELRLPPPQIRTLLELSWRRDGAGLAVATVRADAFCHNMVRALVGAMITVGEGHREPGWAGEVLRRGERDPRVTVVHAHGLTLEEVGYPDDAGLAAQADAARRVRTLPGQQRYDEPGGGLARTGAPRG